MGTARGSGQRSRESCGLTRTIRFVLSQEFGAHIRLEASAARVQPFLEARDGNERCATVIHVRGMSDERVVADVEHTSPIRVGAFGDYEGSDDERIRVIRVGQHEVEMLPHSSITNDQRCTGSDKIHERIALAAD